MENVELKVLWIEDEPDFLEIAKSIIIKTGYIPIVAQSPEEGIKLFKEEINNIVLVLCDYMMPIMNGFEVRKATLTFGESVPFGIVSAYVTKQMALDALGLKICGFFDKPFQIENMIEVIKKESENRASYLKESKILEGIFIEEATSILDDIEPALLSLENDRTNLEILKTISRGAHTLKGSSGCLTNNIITKYVHKYEDLVSALQKNTLNLTDDIYDILFKGFDRIKELINSISNKKLNNYNIDLLLPEVTIDLNKNKVDKQENINKENNKNNDHQVQKLKDNIAVPIYMLDELSGFSGEITVIRNMVNKIIRTLEQKYNDNKDIQNLGELFDEMNKINSTIQNRITDLCKVPLSSVFKPIPRIIRDLSKELGKNIFLKIEGENLRVANSLLVVCSNSLIHLVRNSADHGIESPDDRIKVSKPEMGTIHINCVEDNNDVIVSIKDDGKGLDLEKIRQKAIEKELFTDKQLSLMSEQQTYEIIFASGFSTAAKLTDVSGRGVGMDMVKSSVEAVGGKIEINSKLGEGTTFKLKLPKPKSVLIINSLLVQCLDRCFAVPQDSIVSVISLEKEKYNQMVKSLSFGNVLQYGDYLYPLLELKKVLKLNSTSLNEEKSIFDILILQTDHFTYALQVDGILDSEEIVLKRLNSCFNYKGIYSGATFMGDGSIGLILDVKNIALASGIKLENIKSEMSKIKLNQNLVKENNSLINYLLFKIESKSIYGIPLKNVFRLEEIDKSKIQYSGSNKVITYRDGIMPIYSMENILNLSKKSDLIDEQRDQLSVIVLENIEGYMGFEVPKIIDIVLGENEIKKEVRDRIGVLGNAFIQDHTVTILDMPSVLMKTINLNN